MTFEGRDLSHLDEAEMRKLRGNRIAMIFQEPMTSLNPVLTIGDQIAEAVRIHTARAPAQARARAVEMLRLVRIPDAERRAERLSASVLRRHAPARDDRHGAGLQSDAC